MIPINLNISTITEIINNFMTPIAAIGGLFAFCKKLILWSQKNLRHRKLKKKLENEELIEFLDRKKLSVRKRKKYSEFLCCVLRDTNNYNWCQRRDAAAALKNLQFGVRELAEALHIDPETKVRCMAAESLGFIGNKKAVPHLLLHCYDSSKNVLISVATSLGLIPADRVEKPLENLLNHDSFIVQEAAIEAMKNINDENCVLILKDYILEKGKKICKLVSDHSDARMDEIDLDKLLEDWNRIIEVSINAIASIKTQSTPEILIELHSKIPQARNVIQQILRNGESSLN